MSDVLYMAWRYLAHHRVKTVVLTLTIGLIAFIPAALRVLVLQAETQFNVRAETTPLVLGAKKSPLELALGALYFSDSQHEPITYGDFASLVRTDLANAIPLYLRFRSRNAPIVATSLEYFDFRGLVPAAGRPFAQIGECVVGSSVARDRELAPGDFVISSSDSRIALADGYPLKMLVTGVLKESHGPDDRAIFVDLKTAWVMAGLGHGHDDLLEKSSGVLRRDGNEIVANSSVRTFQEITSENIESFHFHGDRDAFPMTAVIVVPPNHKAKTLMIGRYDQHRTLELIESADVMTRLLDTILNIEHIIVVSVASVSLAALALVGLVFALSLRLRQAEIDTMVKIGVPRTRLLAILATEVATVLGLGILLAAGLTFVVWRLGAELVRAFLVA